MSANVEFNITAFDQASSVFQDVGNSATECFTTVSTSALEAAGNISSSSSEVTTATESSISSFGKNATAMNTAAMSASSLIMGISNIENAEVSLDRAHVTLEKDTNAVQSAQEKYNQAVAEYGSKSQQAIDAGNKLKAAQDAVAVAQEKVDEAQRNVNNTIMMSALQIIPGVVGAFTSLNTVFAATPAFESAVAVATGVVSTALDFLSANPIVLVIAGIAALALGLYYAYEHCGPFRDAVNEIGSILGGAFKVALTAVTNALTWLWNNIFRPFGEFLYGVFVSQVEAVEAIWNAVSTAVTWLWHNVLEPVANFFETIFTDAIDVAMAPVKAFESAIEKVSNAVKPLTSIIGDLGNALKGLCFAHAAPAAEEFNKQITSSIELSNSLTQKLDPLKHGLLGIAGGASGANVSQVGLQGATQHITVNPTIQIGKIDRTTGLSDVINAVSQGTALALQRRF